MPKKEVAKHNPIEEWIGVSVVVRLPRLHEDEEAVEVSGELRRVVTIQSTPHYEIEDHDGRLWLLRCGSVAWIREA